MALADTGKAIGKVTELLCTRLHKHLKDEYGLELTVTARRPEPPQAGLPGKRLNIFLYESLFDPSLKNVSLDEGRPAPLWLVLKYIITAFDDAGDSDTAQAHEYLGEGLRALQELSFLPLVSSDGAATPPDPALKDNPEALKITFEEVPSDLLSKLMQGTDEKYRFSAGFQVRPVMIATGEPPSYSLLVGVDYTLTPTKVIGEKGIRIDVMPTMGPELTSVSPSTFETGETLTLRGVNFDLSGLSVRLGSAALAITVQKPDLIEFMVDGETRQGKVISAGSHALRLVQTLASGKERTSNLLEARLIPILDKVEKVGAFQTASSTSTDLYGKIDLTGVLLGTDKDDIVVALYKDGQVVRAFDRLEITSPATEPQTKLRLDIKKEEAVPPGKYRVILRVNGQQPKSSPELEISV